MPVTPGSPFNAPLILKLLTLELNLLQGVIEA